jgi:hypothetical protein
MKTCNQCHKRKRLSEFYVRGWWPWRWSDMCMQCDIINEIKRHRLHNTKKKAADKICALARKRRGGV